MSNKTGIAWTDATFNCWWGCTKVSPGCDHCYAETWSKRVGMQLWGVDAPRRVFDHKHWNEPLRWNRLAQEGLLPDGKTPRGDRRPRVFCASMADVFENHPALPEERDKLWTLIHKTPNLDWQLLTKRIGNVARMVPPSWLTGHWPAHVQLGISVVNQEEATRDIPKLAYIPAPIRFLSIEPQLGTVDLCEPLGIWWNQTTRRFVHDHAPLVQWVIVGGESGGKARGFRVEWARSIVRQCRTAGVPVFVKQMGAFVIDRNDAGFDGCEPWEWPLNADGSERELEHDIHGYQEHHQGADVRVRLKDRAGADPSEWPENLRIQEFPT